MATAKKAAAKTAAKKTTTGGKTSTAKASTPRVPLAADPREGDAAAAAALAASTATTEDFAAKAPALPTGAQAPDDMTKAALRETLVQKRPLTNKRDAEDHKIDVVVPRGFTLTDDVGRPHFYAEGTTKMLESHATHKYAKANGVTIKKTSK